MLYITNHSLTDTSLKVSDFIKDNKEWNIDTLQPLLDQVCLQLILAVPIPFNPISESVCWGLFGNGEFSIKSATWAAHGENLGNPLVWEYNWIWKLDIMPKLKIFLCQLYHVSLPTKDNLCKRGMYLNPRCPFCQTEKEDADHLFFHC